MFKTRIPLFRQYVYFCCEKNTIPRKKLFVSLKERVSERARAECGRERVTGCARKKSPNW